MAVNNPISGLNKIFDNRVRLGVMSILMVNDEVNFNDLKQMLEVTDGNLATHLQTLDESGYLKVHKGFIGKKTNTTYSMTRVGEKAFKEHIEGLEKMIKGIR
jgi:DNA-binding MarR family transcriptional regulator